MARRGLHRRREMLTPCRCIWCRTRSTAPTTRQCRRAARCCRRAGTRHPEGAQGASTWTKDGFPDTCANACSQALKRTFTRERHWTRSWCGPEFKKRQRAMNESESATAHGRKQHVRSWSFLSGRARSSRGQDPLHSSHMHCMDPWGSGLNCSTMSRKPSSENILTLCQ